MKINPNQFELLKSNITAKANELQQKKNVSVEITAVPNDHYDKLALKFIGDKFDSSDVSEFCKGCMVGCVIIPDVTENYSASLINSKSGVILMNFDSGSNDADELEADFYFDEINDEKIFWGKIDDVYCDSDTLLFDINEWRENCFSENPVEKFDDYIDREIEGKGWIKIYSYNDTSHNEDERERILYVKEINKDTFEIFTLRKPEYDPPKKDKLISIDDDWSVFFEWLYTSDEKLLMHYKTKIKSINKKELEDLVVGDLNDTYGKGLDDYNDFISEV